MEIAAVSKINAPATGAPVQAAVSPLEQHRDIIEAVKAVNRAELLGYDRELAFRLDRAMQRPVIEIVDRRTREVIQQVPPEYLLRATADLGKKDEEGNDVE